MTVSYKKLWKLLIDRDLKKKDLEAMAQVSHYTMNKLTHGDNVTTDVLGRICKALDCSLDDIWSFVMNKSLICAYAILKTKPKQQSPRLRHQRSWTRWCRRKTVDKFSQVVERDEIRRNALQCGIGDIMELTKDVI